MMKPVQPSTPASPTPRARSAPFSVHSRGVMLFDQHRFLDGKFIGLGIFRCCPACVLCCPLSVLHCNSCACTVVLEGAA